MQQAESADSFAYGKRMVYAVYAMRYMPEIFVDSLWHNNYNGEA
jgi:hypothetical protein